MRKPLVDAECKVGSHLLGCVDKIFRIAGIFDNEIKLVELARRERDELLGGKADEIGSLAEQVRNSGLDAVGAVFVDITMVLAFEDIAVLNNCLDKLDAEEAKACNYGVGG